jgi:hypothetical protein
MFLIAGFLIAIPTFSLIIGIDSMYYGQLTFVPLNFFKRNIIDDISSTFGVESSYWYFTHTILYGFNSSLIILILSIRYNVKRYFKDGTTLLMIPLLWVSAYITVLSLIPHKESRFMLPIFPYLFLFMGDFIKNKINKLGNILRILLIGFFIQEIYVMVVYINFDNL